MKKLKRCIRKFKQPLQVVFGSWICEGEKEKKKNCISLFLSFFFTNPSTNQDPNAAIRQKCQKLARGTMEESFEKCRHYIYQQIQLRTVHKIQVFFFISHHYYLIISTIIELQFLLAQKFFHKINFTYKYNQKEIERPLKHYLPKSRKKKEKKKAEKT